MAVGWLNNALSKAQAPGTSIISILKKNMGGWEPARDHTTVHASDITKDHFCPKQWALLDITKKEKKAQWVPTALRATFDVGNVTSDLVRERWLGEAAHGFWRCQKCEKKSAFGVKPASLCSGHVSDWKYVEAGFLSPEYEVSGSVDVFIDMDAKKLFATELKIISPVDFETLAAPLSEHRIRTNLYMKLIEDSATWLKERMNLQEAKVLYVSRAYGKKHPELGEILPFKEFTVKRDDSMVEKPLAQAKEIVVYKQTGLMPKAICGTSKDTAAKWCSVCTSSRKKQHEANLRVGRFDLCWDGNAL
jgi:hypothetical protein